VIKIKADLTKPIPPYYSVGEEPSLIDLGEALLPLLRGQGVLSELRRFQRKTRILYYISYAVKRMWKVPRGVASLSFSSLLPDGAS